VILGSHVSLSGKDQFLGSVKEAISYNSNAFMVYTGAPQNTIRKPIKDLKIPEAHQLMKESGFEQRHVIVHAPYIVNLANPDPKARLFAAEFIEREVFRTNALGSQILVLHPGNHLGQGIDVAIKLIADGLDRILTNTAHLPVMIALEGMAGKGTEVGRSFSELRAIIDHAERGSQLGVCFDTCHSYDAGYDVKTGFNGVIDEFDRVIGINRLLVLHVNDSKNAFASGKDRHENIGFGSLGFAALLKVINHPKLSEIPKILETPYVPSITNPKKSYPPYLHEIKMIASGTFDPNLKEKIIAYYEGEA